MNFGKWMRKLDILNSKNLFIKGWNYGVFWKIMKVWLRKILLNFSREINPNIFLREFGSEKNGLIIGPNLFSNN